jgi:hypothetical protein
MGYFATIEPTKFESVRDNEVTYGYRYYDDYVSGYNNGWDDIPENDEAVLRCAIRQADEGLQGILDFLMEEAGANPDTARLSVGDIRVTNERVRQIYDEVHGLTDDMTVCEAKDAENEDA